MSRTRVPRSAACLLLACLAACGEPEQEPPQAIARPVKTFFVEGGSADALRTFPGRVDASQRADLSFRVPGQVMEILVREGDLVEAGEVLARLDPTDYELALEDRQATFDNARSHFERGKELIRSGNISRVDYDNMESTFRSASAALSQAKRNLEYTVITSPFHGRVAERRVENFEEVQAKQIVFSLQDTSELDIVIDVPESVIRMVRSRPPEQGPITRDERIRETRAYAMFEGRPGERYPLRPKEIATKANEQTQTFRATLSMDAPEALTLLPGMTATVLLDLSHLVDDDPIKRVPARAVQADSGLRPRVWVLDPDSMTVSGREVALGRMSGDMIQVLDGLDGGEEIVAVGAPFLFEGMRVTRMPRAEQAVPREDDLF